MKKIFAKLFVLALCGTLVLGMCACNGNTSDATEVGESGGISYSAKYNGQTVRLGKKADSVLDKLGEPVSELNTGNCGGLGETTRYDYKDITLVVVDYENGDELIDQIVLNTDGAETAEGIYIGSSEADVIKAYGEGTLTGKTRIYREDGKELAIGIENGTVSSIVYRCI